MRAIKSFVAAAVVASAAFVATAPASATTYMVTGQTTNTPTFNRPLANGNSAPTALSGVGTAVSYNTFLFTVPTAATFSFLLTSTTLGYDPFLVLYANGFNPASPLTNAVIANDDLGSTLTSGFSSFLTPGVTYTAVITGFDDTDFGGYTLVISDTGVPEPATWGLMIFGMGAIGGAMRYRRKATSVRFA